MTVVTSILGLVKSGRKVIKKKKCFFEEMEALQNTATDEKAFQ